MMRNLRLVAAVWLQLATLMACGPGSLGDDGADDGADDGEGQPAPSDTEVVQAEAVDPGFGGAQHVSRAAQLWQEINDADYQSWPLLSNTEELQRGQSPHGYFVTRRFHGEADQLGDSLILLKLNFDSEGMLAALTAMQKQVDYDPSNQDWFYAKFLPDGTLDQTPGGAALAGGIEPKPGRGCRGCHRNAADGDFVFSNDGDTP